MPIIRGDARVPVAKRPSPFTFFTIVANAATQRRQAV